MEVQTWTFIVVSFVSSLFGLFYLFLKHRYQHWKKKGVKYVEPSIPFGNGADIVLFRKTMGDVYERHYYSLEGEKFGGTFLVHAPQLLLRDPDLIKAILVKDFEHFHDHGFRFDETIDPLTGNLFMLTGAKWKDLRTKLSPTFTSGKMKMMFQTLADCGSELKELLKKPAENEDIFEIKDLAAKFTTDIIASCAFGIQCNCLKDPEAEFRKWGKKIFDTNFENIFRGFIYLFVPSVAIKLKISNTPHDITRFFTSMVRETVGYREKHNVKRNDFLQLLIQLKNKGYIDKEADVDKINTGLTMNELTAQAFVFFAAGFETSSTTMSFALYELALNPDIQERLQKEIDEVLQKHGGKMTYDAIQEMQYLDNVVSETLRKHSPVPFLQRECTKDYKIPGTDVTLEKGTIVVIPIQALHFDQRYFPDPQKFDPDRFNEENKKKRHHYVYLPFGEGPRICIGMRFGLMQTKVGLISMLSNYEFHVCDKTAIPLELDPKQFIHTAKEGIWLQIKKRTK